ncbi:MAG: hypothetical protein LC730_07175 [Acidobacteria bacterium]|nr:hypothetical protein [Acidobacteriota bacterium]MCA1609219.1 hypothetical protein [Acidobacteriota bacterium]
MLYLMQKFVHFLQESGGNIVNVTSGTGIRVFPEVRAYCVSARDRSAAALSRPL